MLQVDIDKITPVTEARDNLNKIVEEVDNSDVMHVLTKNGTPVAVIVGVNHLEKLTGQPFENNSASASTSTVASSLNDDKDDEPETPEKTAELAVPDIKTSSEKPLQETADADSSTPLKEESKEDTQETQLSATTKDSLDNPSTDPTKDESTTMSSLPGSVPASSPTDPVTPAANDDLFSDFDDQPTTGVASNNTDTTKKSIFDDDLTADSSTTPSPDTAPVANEPIAPTVSDSAVNSQNTPLAEPLNEQVNPSESPAEPPLAASAPATDDQSNPTTPAPAPETSYNDFIAPPTTPGIVGADAAASNTPPVDNVVAPIEPSLDTTSNTSTAAATTEPTAPPTSDNLAHPNYSFDQNSATNDQNQPTNQTPPTTAN